ncbi:MULTISPECIES: MmgE/PrpD family protein [Enterocloster]|uniref:2-methylcitrate dehydratase PrpD n=1 Tax=Enterocloster lavalensis TaxID=460384 RepID=A0A1I0FB82_9FIRM|nr:MULTISPECIES: MmgE/PrpD family protein [Enterocloster]MDR3758073.1 MmgE/PrpD family protein [Enterocloster sp.]PST33167.1 MmgE/PrpD family protein [Enterocloster lavalensis]SET55205.1 2-methylcitrate dehydratase PrpD [Enterocloster lavalensis]
METTTQQTRCLAAYLCGMDVSKFSDHTVDITKMCIEDFIGVAIAGSAKKESGIWKEYYSGKLTAPQASTFQPGFAQMTVEQAAALNAVFGHVMDMDDVHNASITHLAVITVPTAFALGQQLGKSGKEIIEAVAAGYEAGARIGEAINPSSYKYWHTTGVVGAFAAGVTAAKLLGLDEEQMVNCLGSAGTQAAGLWEFLASGSMSKVLHTANANLCGLRSAELAKLGFTGAPTILEGDRAFVNALAPEPDLDSLTKGFGESYRIEENSFKPYACCRHTHSANYCIEKILSAHALDPEEIVSITDDTYSTAVQTTNNPYPENPYAAKFSLQFCIAAAIVLKDLSDRTFTVENINNPAVRALMEKIKVKVNKELDDEFKQDPNQWSHRLTICLKNGETITEQVDYPIGDFKNPFDLEMADRKFRLLTEDMIGEEGVTKLLDRLHRLETIQDINEIFN